jgi:hypothetical protein
MGLGFVFFSLSVVGVILSQMGILNVPECYSVLLGGLPFCLLFLYANLFSFLCPRCCTAWGSLALTGTRQVFSIDNRIRFCPFCGCNIDTKEA